MAPGRSNGRQNAVTARSSVRQHGARHRILGLDLATATGAAHSDGWFAKWHLDKIRLPSHPGSKFCALARKLYETYEERPFDYVICELSSFGAGGQQKTRAFLDRLLGVTMAFAADKGVQWMDPVQPKQIKKFATGNGSCDKEAMIQAAVRECQDIGRDHDLADAYFVLRIGEHRLRNSQIFG